MTYDGVISNVGSLEKQGDGTLVLTGNNTYTGYTAISNDGGTLQIGNNGTTGSIASNTVSVLNNATLAFKRSDDVTYSGNISGSGGLTKLGAGKLTLSGNNNTYGGITLVSDGTLELSGGTAIGNHSAVINNANIDLRSSQTVGSLAGTGRVGLISGDLTVGSNDTSTTYSGIIVGQGGLVKIGNGTLTLGGGNTYTGSTNVNSGTLALTNADSLGGDGLLDVHSGAAVNATSLGNSALANTLHNDGEVQAPTGNGLLRFTGNVSGEGSFTGNVEFSADYSPGNSPAITHLENAIFDSTSHLLIEIGGLIAGTDYDQVSVSGTATLGGSLDISWLNGFLLSPGDTFTVMTYGSYTGSFASITGLNNNGMTLRAIYNADNLELVVDANALPEPGTIWLFGTAMPILARLRRRLGPV